MESIACIRCIYWRSKTNESGWCTIGDHMDGMVINGRCVDGKRGLYPVTFALDGCQYGADRDKSAL
jgi:hypothetical protein